MSLQVKNVSKSFGKVQAVNQVSLEVPPGEICGLLGPNGAGKTTLIRMIMDIFKPDQGAIRLGDGLQNDLKGQIGYLPEERGLYSKTKVAETLCYFARLKGLTRKQAHDNVTFFLDRLNMTAAADKKIGTLSKGNQQKIQIISAIVSKPPMLILDEPFSGLDPMNVRLVSELISELNREGRTILLSTHQMNQAETFCSRIFLFNQGSLILDGSLEALIDAYSGKFLLLETDQPLGESHLFQVVTRESGVSKIQLAEHASLRSLMGWLATQPVETSWIKPFRVPLSEIFIREVEKHE